MTIPAWSLKLWIRLGRLQRFVIDSKRLLATLSTSCITLRPSRLVVRDLVCWRLRQSKLLIGRRFLTRSSRFVESVKFISIRYSRLLLKHLSFYNLNSLLNDLSLLELWLLGLGFCLFSLGLKGILWWLIS